MKLNEFSELSGRFKQFDVQYKDTNTGKRVKLVLNGTSKNAIEIALRQPNIEIIFIKELKKGQMAEGGLTEFQGNAQDFQKSKTQKVDLNPAQKKRLVKTFGELSKTAKSAQTAAQKSDGKTLTLALRTMKIGMKLITRIIQDKS
jgi:hypothetical protein